MATSTEIEMGQEPMDMLALRDMIAVLIKHFGYHEGHYELAFEFSVAIGSVGPRPDQLLPGAMLGIRGIGINRVETATPGSIDASVVNPRNGAAPAAAAPTS